MRSKYQGRFGGTRRSADLSEDVNPSAYIVNLADCMLVLACGFMVAMIAYWGIDLNETFTDDEMQQVDADVVPEDLEGSGSNYVEAGKVYVDTATGEYYILKQDANQSASASQTTGEQTTDGQVSAGQPAADQADDQPAETNETADDTQQGADQAAPEGDETG